MKTKMEMKMKKMKMKTLMLMLITPVTEDLAEPILTVSVEFELGFFVVEAAEAKLLRLVMMMVMVMTMMMVMTIVDKKL